MELVLSIPELCDPVRPSTLSLVRIGLNRRTCSTDFNAISDNNLFVRIIENYVYWLESTHLLVGERKILDRKDLSIIDGSALWMPLRFGR